MKVAIIPVRGGSKRIPGKNGRPFLGTPLLEYAIRVCQDSSLFDHILVSTDNLDLVALAQKCGAEVPFLRPADLAGDQVPTAPVVEHALSWIRVNWGEPEHYCQLYANPFIRAENLRRAHELLLTSGARAVLAVTEFPYPILRAFKVVNGGVEYAFPEYRLTRSQDMPTFYHDAGQFYWHNPSFSLDLALPLILPRHQVVDIDTEEDWLVAENLFRTMEGTSHVL